MVALKEVIAKDAPRSDPYRLAKQVRNLSRAVNEPRRRTHGAEASLFANINNSRRVISVQKSGV